MDESHLASGQRPGARSTPQARKNAHAICRTYCC